MQNNEKRSFLPVYLLSFVNTIGFTILIPVLPFVVDRYNAGALTYGLLLSAYSFFQFLATPLIGSLSDKYGRRPALILSQTGTFLSWMIFAVAYFLPNQPVGPTSLPILVIFFSRVIDGITGGNNSVTNAYVSDLTGPQERTKYYGIIGAFMGIGFIFGPAIGGYSSSFEIGYLGTVIIASIISLITLFSIIFGLEESLKDIDKEKHLEIHLIKEINIFKKIKDLSKNKTLKYLFSRRFFFAFAFACFTSTFALYAKDSLGLNSRQLGFILLFVGVFSVINQTVIVQKVAKKFGNHFTFNIGQAILALSILAISLHPNIYLFVVFMYFTNLGMSLSMPTLRSMLTETVDRKMQGRVLGVDESILAGNNGLAPVLAGAIYSWISYFSFGIFGTIVILPIIYYSFFNKQPQEI